MSGDKRTRQPESIGSLHLGDMRTFPHGSLEGRGFTLIELLVVISIISLLLALLLPALARVRQSAEQVTCLSNIRQLLIATQGYINDFGYYPQPFQDSTITDPRKRADALWFNALDYYLDQQKIPNHLAANRNQHPAKQDPIWHRLEDPQNNRTLKMNEGFGDFYGPARFTRDSQIRQPTLTVVFVDGRAQDLRHDDGIAGNFHATEGDVGLRHDDGANVGFADGHASLEKQTIRITPTRGDRVWHRHGTDFTWVLE